MTANTRRPRPSPATRRVGYFFGILVTGAILFGTNVWPGWEAVPFLSSDFDQIIGLVNVSLVLSILFNLVYIAYDPQWLKSSGDLVTTVIGLVVLVWMWNVFPFTFEDDSVWSPIARICLAFLIAVTSIASVVLLVLIGRAAFSTDGAGSKPQRRVRAQQ